MTDSNDLSNSDRSPEDDAADARWFRSAVSPVVDTRPVPDAWEDIRARATGEAPTVVQLAPTAGTGRGAARRRLALVAAGVLALAGLGGALVVSREGDSDRETITATPPTAEGTGWFIPRDLPEGWELESVETDWLDVEGRQPDCPCQEVIWTSPDGESKVATFSARPDAAFASLAEVQEEQEDVEEIDLGGGYNAHAGTAGPYEIVSWADDERSWQVASADLDRAAVVAAAARLSVDPAAAPIEGYEVLFRTPLEFGDARAYHSVLVRIRHAARGVSLGYELDPFGTDVAFTLMAGSTDVVTFGDDELPLHRVAIDVDSGLAGPTGEPPLLFVGQWPGAAVRAGLDGDLLSSGPAGARDVEALLASLRPATGEEWQAFLDTATGTVEDDARADRLSDLIVYEGDTVPEADDPSAAPSPAQADPPSGEDLYRPASDVAVFSQAVEAGRSPGVTTQDLFASTVDIGLDFETHRTIGGPNLVDPQAWVIDGDDVEQYAGRTPPFSAAALLAGTTSISIVDGVADGCPADSGSPTPPPVGDGERLLTITPDDVDSCIDWFAVTLVVDEQNLINAVHLYLREP